MVYFRELLTKCNIEEDSLYEGKFSDLRASLLAGKKATNPASDLAKSATEDANSYTKKYGSLLSSGNRKHHLTLMQLSTQAYMAHFIAGHTFPKDSSGQKVHFDAAKGHFEVAEVAKKQLYK